MGNFEDPILDVISLKNNDITGSNETDKDYD